MNPCGHKGGAGEGRKRGRTPSTKASPKLHCLLAQKALIYIQKLIRKRLCAEGSPTRKIYLRSRQRQLPFCLHKRSLCGHGDIITKLAARPQNLAQEPPGPKSIDLQKRNKRKTTIWRGVAHPRKQIQEPRSPTSIYLQ